VANVPSSRHLARARDFVDAHYDEPITVADIAETAGLSPAHFSREFRRSFGEAPHQYVIRRRLERSAMLLRTTDWPITRICITVGWSSLGSFTTSFTRMFGRSPGTYRAAFPPPAARVRIPACIVKVYGRPELRTFREANAADHPAYSPDQDSQPAEGARA
jgi:AraC-like DNA-binding protein